MDTNKLIAAGLNDQQAKAYALLIEAGGITPPEAAKQLYLTRSNAYKTLDRLVEMGLAERKDVRKKLTYLPTNPAVFADLSARQRAEATAREEAVSSIMQDLISKYYAHTDKPGVDVYTGRKEVARAYHKQLALREDIYFVHTSADIPMMGFDILHEIRSKPARGGNHRYGIMSAPTDGPVNFASHKRTNLEVTWIDKSQYDSPVEWSTTKSSLLIVTYAADPQAVLIMDPVIASAFIQIWKMMDALLKPSELHRTMQPKWQNS